MFSDEQRRGLIVVVPLLLAVLLLSVLVERRTEPVLLAERGPTRTEADSAAVLRPFDPNRAEYEELRLCGVPPAAAAGIVRWRRYGKVYRMKEDIALCSGVDDSLYALLKPYIVIDEEHAARPRREYSPPSPSAELSAGSGGSPRAEKRTREIRPRPFSLDTVTVPFLVEMGFSPRQSEAVLRYRDASGGIRNEEQFRRCYVVSEEMADRLAPYIVFAPAERADTDSDPCVGAADAAYGGAAVLVEINTADSAALRSVRGIGEKSVTAIMRYRELLGGFYSVEQLAELDVVTESNYERILTQICCDSCEIQKIDINFAPPSALKGHPYLPPVILRKLLSKRQLKGGWRSTEELVEDNILTRTEAARLAPYLRFTLRQTPIEAQKREDGWPARQDTASNVNKND